MTGILPIAKELSQSTINCFKEYTMLEDGLYYKYFSFTEKEVKELEKNVKYTDLEDWYNGYNSCNDEKIYNTWSICQALRDDKINDYWTKTGRIYKVVDIINFNLEGIKNDILNLITNEGISMKLENYGIEDMMETTREKTDLEKKGELYSLMINYGYLTYYKGKITIPNKELKQKFKIALMRNEDLKCYYDLMEKSKDIHDATLDKKPEKVCKILKEIQINEAGKNEFYNYNTLNFIVKFAYFYSRDTYKIQQDGY